MMLHYNSGLKEDSCKLSVEEILESLTKLVRKCLNGKRIEILKTVAENGDKTITSVVDVVSKSSGYPKSTVWMNVNFLKEIGLIKNTRGKPVRLTPIGMMILERMEGERNRG